MNRNVAFRLRLLLTGFEKSEESKSAYLVI